MHMIWFSFKVAELEILPKPATVKKIINLESYANKLCVNDLSWSSIDVAVQSYSYIGDL